MRGKVPEDDLEPARPERGDVFDDDEAGPKGGHKPSVLGPKAASSTRKASASAGEADVLAGEAAADEVDGGELVADDGSDVGEPVDAGPPSSKDSCAEWVILYLPKDAHAARLEPEVQAADASEEAAHREGHAFSPK